MSARLAQRLAEAFAQCREGTLALVADIPDERLYAQAHEGFSPLAWHLGHIAYTEGLWLVGPAGLGVPRADWRRFFDVEALPKGERGRLPPRAGILAYMAEMGAALRTALSRERFADGGRERIWRFVLQHEAMHGETMAIIRALHGLDPLPDGGWPDLPRADDARVEVPAGTVEMGHDGPDAMDNERPVHEVEVAAFAIDRWPVTQARYAAFMAAGGYRERRWWSGEGWAWREAGAVERPLHWREGRPDMPVCGASVYEAEAYCRFAGRRLPREAEWARAAASGVLEAADGAVWQWTADAFAAYPGFEPWPYRGYSASWFDGAHRVMRGSSFATPRWCRRRSFRNWYQHDVRQPFVGFRCAG